MTYPSTNEFVKISNPYTYDIKKGRTYYNKAVVRTIKQEFEAGPPQKIIFIQGSEGAGKSSTLDRIKNEPEILGDRYMPVYIHSNRVISGKGGDLLANLYDCLKKSIDEAGVQPLDDPVGAVKANVTREGLHHLLAALEEKKRDSGRIILLIFDDFDKFFEQEDIREHIRVIRLFKDFSDKSRHVRILLSGRADLRELLENKELAECLEDILIIKMKIFDTREFNKAITGPVKDFVTYSPEALAEIRKMSGDNLYCQQLLCHYIILHLNNEKKNRCGALDVERAVELTITDERHDFNHFWERLSVEDKLVCSAIMDENVVKKRGLYYFIDQSSLLPMVFEPEALNRILSVLYKDDFIPKVEGRRFAAFPFKIPLYGYWIRKQHPFAGTVVDHIDTIAREKDFPALGEIAANIPGDMFPYDRKDTFEFIREWFQIKNTLKEWGRVSREEIEVPLEIICKIMGLEIKDKGRPGLEYFTIDFERLNIGSIEEALFFIQDRLELEKDDIHHLMDMILTHVNATKPCLFFCLKRNKRIDELVQKTFLNIILIENDDLKSILFSSRPRQMLKEILLQRISSSQISPYKTDGPAITTFYGRQRELKKILGTANRSYSIIGARKIGKSSLLARIKMELEGMRSYSVFMDLESPTNQDHTSFLQRMELELGRVFRTDIHFGSDIGQFNTGIRKLPTNGKKLIVILDEIDELLLYDEKKGYPLFRMFRSLFQEGYCKFIFSGFEVLQNVKRGIGSPFYNFCEEIKLGPLDKENAVDLITEPMANIGIAYKNSSDRNYILKYTARHPNLIQFFCKHLIEALEENPDPIKRRLITRSNIKSLYNFEYENYVINDFYMFYSDLDDLEKLIVILLVACYPGERSVSIKLVNRELMTNGVDLRENLIHNTIQKLILRFILLDKGKGKYSFALPSFPEMLRSRIEDDLKESLVRRLKERNVGESV